MVVVRKKINLHDKIIAVKKIWQICLYLGTVLSAQAQSNASFRSPNGNLLASIQMDANGVPTYQLLYKNQAVIQSGLLGIELKDQSGFTSALSLLETKPIFEKNNWSPIWGEDSTIVNEYRGIICTFEQSNHEHKRMQIEFRLFNDGLAFRYLFPNQPNLQHFIIDAEKTSFNLTGDHKTFWIPGDYDTNEYLYYTTKLSEVDARVGAGYQEISTKTPFHPKAVQTPLMMKSANGLYINIHEAALINYPAMQLIVDSLRPILSAHLVPDAVGNKAYLQTPAKSPWRTILVSDQATEILASRTILNLNEPCAWTHTDWIKPMKFMGIWWEMHVGKSTWDYAGTMDATPGAVLKPSGKHGATTENTKRYIDFAATHGIDGILVEGWNVGWEDWFGKWKEDVFDFVTPYPDFNMFELQAYAKKKGVQLIMHHETSASVTNYERYLDTAFKLMNQLDYPAVKTGYVGKIIPRGEHHDGQWMVNHYNRVAIKAAAHQIMIDAHEPVRPTGLHRTFPNWLASEAARGNEFNAWSRGNAPEHETILPFTRLMGGPMDYTPGIFKIKMNHYKADRKEQVHTTLAKQLALYVTMYSPLQMAADLPENYQEKLDAFQFIKEVPVDWSRSIILAAEPGDYITIARKAKNKDAWYIGSITDEKARLSNISCQFLTPDKKYLATIYQDGVNADWEKNPESYQINQYIIDQKTALSIQMANGGGYAISIVEANASDLKSIKPYKK